MKKYVVNTFQAKKIQKNIFDFFSQIVYDKKVNICLLLIKRAKCN